jgi:NAD(P)-dependent dehydrogenase (short-subunit alcohol dehydrogenase family)
MSTLKGKVAVVTGGARGLGAAFAHGLSRSGATVAVCDVLDTSDIIKQIKSSGSQAYGATVDVSHRARVDRFVESVIGEFKRIDILINNAAIFASIKMKPFEQIAEDEWEKVLRVNVLGPVNFARAVVPTMRRQQYGKIVNIVSGAAFTGPPMLLHYVASKGAGVSMTRSLARELGDSGIRVNAIAPGFTISEGVATGDSYPQEIRDRMISIRALKREQVPEDLVGAMLFLSGADSDFITGQTFVVDGGNLMR